MGNKIKGRCFTNLDGYSSDVTVFARVPNIGERVGAHYNGVRTSLKVVQITHDDDGHEPFLIIELHK